MTVTRTSGASATEHVPGPAVAELRTHCCDVSQREAAIIGRQPTSPKPDILDKFESSRKSAIAIAQGHAATSRATYSDSSDINRGHNHDRTADEALSAKCSGWRAPEHHTRLGYNVWVLPELSHVMISRIQMYQVTRTVTNGEGLVLQWCVKRALSPTRLSTWPHFLLRA